MRTQENDRVPAFESLTVWLFYRITNFRLRLLIRAHPCPSVVFLFFREER